MLEWREERVDPVQCIKEALSSLSGQISGRISMVNDIPKELPEVIF